MRRLPVYLLIDVSEAMAGGQMKTSWLAPATTAKNSMVLPTAANAANCYARQTIKGKSPLAR